MDFGGPNVAKALHVGHLRSAVIGESIRRIESFYGNEVISDVHFGDWGTPMGMILAEIINQDGDLSKTESYDIEAISAFYKKPTSAARKTKPPRKKRGRLPPSCRTAIRNTARPGSICARFRSTRSKKNYDDLEAHFDLWLGESDAHEASSEIVKIAKEKGLAELDDGALIIRLEEGNKPKPPVILIKSDGGFGYQITDIATIKMRYDDLKADEIIYVVDKRQSLHFEQVFEASENSGLRPGSKCGTSVSVRSTARTANRLRPATAA